MSKDNKPLGELKLDWLTFTFKPPMDVLEETGKSYLDSFKAFFPEFDEVWENTYIFQGNRCFYDIVLIFNDLIRISFNNMDNPMDMGLNISVPAHGLPWLMEIFKLENEFTCVYDLFKILDDRYCHATRIDVAFDDFTKTFSPNYYGTKFIEREMFNDGKECNYITTKYRRMNFVTSESTQGSTFYLGSRQSGRMMRIYDKNYESHGEIDSVRYEIELHKDYAQAFVKMMLEDAEKREFNFGSMMLGMFRIIQHDTLSEKAKCSIDPEWDAWMKKMFFDNEETYVMKLSLNNNYATSFYRSAEYFNNSLLNLVTTIWHVFGTEMFFNQLHENYKKGLPDKYTHMVNNFLSRFNDDEKAASAFLRHQFSKELNIDNMAV